MELQAALPSGLASDSTAPVDKLPVVGGRAPAIRWFKEWVSQDLLATGGKCMVLKWVKKDVLKALKEKIQEPESEEPEPGPTTKVLHLCSYEGCGKTFIDLVAIKKHSHVHGEKQFVCHYEGCGKRFLDKSKLKRHFLVHTCERAFICTSEGCGKAFSLAFNLRVHMRTHSQENYHVCPHEACGKRYAHLYKLQAHVKAQHERDTVRNAKGHNPLEEKASVTPQPVAIMHSDRPHACPYEGCGKSYIHEYKLKLHLRRRHPSHNPEGNSKITPIVEHDKNSDSEQDAYFGRTIISKKSKKEQIHCSENKVVAAFQIC